MPEHRHTNRLIEATSPYLLQHAHNPVDWRPWGEEALRESREHDRPIFLSIGYSSCHWCHVMERESFENEAVAAVLNREFIPIKVDREERPDLDEIYMAATQLMTQSGGWPMSVFLTPELKPFYAGTYFPPDDRWGRPGFMSLLAQLATFWRDRRTDVEAQAAQLTEAVAQFTGRTDREGAVTAELLRAGLVELARGFDARNGGFGGAPKFPPSMRLELLLRRAEADEDDRLLSMVTTTLDRMARGGMYDQIGGGFARYSVDERWLVPHFEKMLYDNALLARIYALAYERTGEWYYERVTREILAYVLREMTHPEGGFYSATDADSEGIGGKFFVWTPDEVFDVLGDEDGALFCRIYDISPQGNWEGHSIPNLLKRDLASWADELGTDAEALDEQLAPMRRKLWERRERRVHPLLDDKVLTAWNGLMIRAFAEAGRVFQDDEYTEAAERAAEFVLTNLRDGDRLLRSFRDGKAGIRAYQEDYAYLALALLDLYNTGGELRWRDEALQLLDQMDAGFWNETEGGYYFTSHDHERLIARTRSLQDGATPSGNSVAAQALIRAVRASGQKRYQDHASTILRLGAPQMTEYAAAFPNMLVAADEYLRTWPEGVRVPGEDAVKLAGFVSRGAVEPGGTVWIGIQAAIRDGFHINSWQPTLDYLVPTRMEPELPEGFAVSRESYPPAVDYHPEHTADTLQVYEGTARFGLEVVVAGNVAPGAYTVPLTLRLQPCNNEQCYPPMEARMRFIINVAATAGPEQHSDVFDTIRARA